MMGRAGSVALRGITHQNWGTRKQTGNTGPGQGRDVIVMRVCGAARLRCPVRIPP